MGGRHSPLSSHYNDEFINQIFLPLKSIVKSEISRQALERHCIMST